MFATPTARDVKKIAKSPGIQLTAEKVEVFQAMATEQLERVRGGVHNMVRNTRPFNYTGHRALAVPCGKSEGLASSIQPIGRFFDDPLVLRVAYAYQESVDWEDITAVGR
jgi:Asp-tRNA(Asn)/Glu-tRNA(Gln) amidotransferase A subunit family amidase